MNWSLLGSPFTTITSPFTIATTGGSLLTVSHDAGSLFERRDQTPTGGWSGNFASGDALLWNRGDSGPVVFDPSDLVKGAGFNVQSDSYGFFSFTLEAYDLLGGLLGSVTRTGNSNALGNGSAIFVGFTSASANVDKFVAYMGNGTNFAINSMVLSSPALIGNAFVPVPEPSVYGLLGAVFVLGTVVHQRLRRAHDV